MLCSSSNGSIANENISFEMLHKKYLPGFYVCGGVFFFSFVKDQSTLSTRLVAVVSSYD